MTVNGAGVSSKRDAPGQPAQLRHVVAEYCGEEMGDSRLRRQLLAWMGWDVVVVPWYEWAALKSKEELLSEKVAV